MTIWLLMIDYVDGTSGLYGFARSPAEVSFFLAFFKPNSVRSGFGPWVRHVVPIENCPIHGYSQLDFRWWDAT